MNIAIGEEWFGIANGLNLFTNNRVVALDGCNNVVALDGCKNVISRLLTSSFWLIFFKLCMDIDIREEWFVIANGLNLFINNRVMALDWCWKCIFLNIFRTNGWILIKFCVCIDKYKIHVVSHVIFGPFLTELWPLISVRICLCSISCELICGFRSNFVYMH